VAERYPINIWINEERFAKLQAAGLSDMAKEAFAGLKVLSVMTTETQKDELIKRFPGSKCDTATTKTVELLPRVFKDKLFDLVIQHKSVEPDVVEKAMAIS